jgi:alpha-1,2-glucosyltransferase
VTSRSNLLFLSSIVFVLQGCAFLLIKDHAMMSDEGWHYVKIQRFTGGDFSGPIFFSGYHLLMSIFQHVFQSSHIFMIRLCTWALGLLSIVAFYKCQQAASDISPRGFAKGQAQGLCGMMQYAFFPILFPFFFLIFTDVPSMLFVLLGLYAALKKNINLSALFGFISMWIRINNVIWCLFFFLFLYVQENGFRYVKKRFVNHLKKGWLFLIIFTACGVAVIMSKGQLNEDARMHPVSLHLGNLYFMCFVFFVMFLPLHITNASKVINLVSRHSWIWLLAFMLFFFYMFTFVNDHPYNSISPDFYLRNKILISVTSQNICKIMFFVPIAYSILSLAVTPLRQRGFYMMYPISALFVSASWLVDPRYYLIPFVLFLVFREKYSLKVEIPMTGYHMVLSAVIFYLMNNHHFFL